MPPCPHTKFIQTTVSFDYSELNVHITIPHISRHLLETDQYTLITTLLVDFIYLSYFRVYDNIRSVLEKKDKMKIYRHIREQV